MKSDPGSDPMLRRVSHPLAENAITHLRDRATSTQEFQRHARLLTQLVALSVTSDLALVEVDVLTPLQRTRGRVLRSDSDIILVPVLRAGVSMLDTMHALLPGSRVGFVGLERDEQTALAREYYSKLPRLLERSQVIILDPMLASGGSALATIRLVREQGAKRVTLATIIAAPEGVRAVHSEHPDVVIHTTALDEGLNDRKFILPGVGDFGDRYYGTT